MGYNKGMTKDYRKLIYLCGFVLIALAVGYSFLSIPLYDKYCEYHATDVVKKSGEVTAQAETIFNQRKSDGVYRGELCTGNEFKGAFANLDSSTPDQIGASPVKLNCKTEFQFVNEIALELYPKIDDRSQKDIAAECKSRF